MGLVIEAGLLGDYILQSLIQGQGRLVLLGDIQRDLGIAVLPCLLLRRLQQARANTLAAPGGEDCQSIYITSVMSKPRREDTSRRKQYTFS